MCSGDSVDISICFCVVQESVQLADGLTLVKQGDAPAAVAEPRLFSGMSGEDRLDAMLRSKFEQLMSTHTLSMDLASEGRGRGQFEICHRFTINSFSVSISIK